jgi:hypothetical protein
MRKLGCIEKSVAVITFLSFGFLGKEVKLVILPTKEETSIGRQVYDPNSSSHLSRQRISYQLRPYNVTNVEPNFGDPYQCRDIKKRHMRRRFEPSAVYTTPGVFDFVPLIETDLNILFMGDSVGIQFSQAFEGAVGGYNRSVIRETSFYELEGYDVHLEGLHSAPTTGGGWIAGWRITGMLRQDGEGKPLPNEPGGGWWKEDAVALADHMYQQGRSKSRVEPEFDSLVFRIPQGWISSEAVNTETMQETIRVAHGLFGVRSVIFVTLPLCNNYRNASDVKAMQEANERIANFAKNYQPTNNNGKSVQHVMFLDFGQLVWELISWNARLIGMQGSIESMFARKVGHVDLNDKFTPAQAHVCARKMNPKSRFGECIRNHLSYDGMHWCMETIGGRVNAGLACLIGCVHNDEAECSDERHLQVQQCARTCNNHFMRIQPNVNTT